MSISRMRVTGQERFRRVHHQTFYWLGRWWIAIVLGETVNDHNCVCHSSRLAKYHWAGTTVKILQEIAPGL